MFGIDDALISAGASILGSALGGWFGKSGQEETNRTNIQLGREQMAFQERMSGSAYQRAVSDMQLAGLNPMLAYSQGGASAPVGSMPQVQNANAAGVSSAVGAMGLAQGIQQIMTNKASMEQLEATTEKIKSETMEREMNAAMLASQVRRTKLEGTRVEEDIPGVRGESQMKVLRSLVEGGAAGYEHTGFAADVARRKAEAILAQLEVPRSKAESEFYKGIGEFNPYLRALIQAASGLSSARRAVGR